MVSHSAPRQGSSRWRVPWLTARVHWDAFQLDPLGYAQAIGWRIRGLRLRSRNRMAALTGRSPHAYKLWVARHEPDAPGTRRPAGMPSQVPVRPIVDCRSGVDGLERTLRSLTLAGAELEPILIGGPPKAGAICIGSPDELARVIDAQASWLCPILPGDELAPAALTTYAAAAANEPSARILYADDDLIDPQGRRQQPHFKPDWNPELFEHHDFLTNAAAVRVTREQLPDLDRPDWAAALVRAAIARGSTPIHLPYVLHHRRTRPEPCVPQKPANLSLAEAPTVTAIVPTRNRAGLLRNCIEGLKRTAYAKLDVIIVDNESDEEETLAYLRELEREGFAVLRIPGPFNYSALNNRAVKHATGELLCFLNNDVEMMDPDWLTMLVLWAREPEFGAVGARLLYPDGTVQHAGVFTGIGGGAAHAHRFERPDEPGYFFRSRLPQRVTAVTAACMVVAKEKFLAVGGFDEAEFPVAFNDVDLCLKLNARGWQSFYEPRATLIHYESKSRGLDRAKPNRARFAGELAALKRKWHTDLQRDPYHHPHLSPFCEQFRVSI